MKGISRPLGWVRTEHGIFGRRRITSIDDQGRRYEKCVPFHKKN